MEFDVVTGNPPYQTKNQPIYNKFIEMAMDIEASIITMITMNNWMCGQTLGDLRDRIIEYGLKTLYNYPLNDIFKDINAGISITHLVKTETAEKAGKTHCIIVKGNKIVADEQRILRVGESIQNEQIQSDIIKQVRTYRNDFESWSLSVNPRIFSIGSNGKFMHADYTEDCIKYTDKRVKETDIEVKFMDYDKSIYSLYADLDTFPKGVEQVSLYKVVCGSKIHNNKKVLTSITIFNPGTALTNSFGIIAMVSSKEKAERIKKYALTKFYRFLALCEVQGARVAFGEGRLIHIPMQDFTDNSDINWVGTIENIEHQLYTKYGLTQDKIEYIEEQVESIKMEE